MSDARRLVEYAQSDDVEHFQSLDMHKQHEVIVQLTNLLRACWEVRR